MSKNKSIKGKTITRIWTLGSMYDNGNIALSDKDGNIYRMKVEDLLPLLNDLTFDTEKKRVHTYLKPKTT